MKKQRETRKTKAEKGRQQEEETWKHENPYPFGGFFLGQFLTPPPKKKKNWRKL